MASHSSGRGRGSEALVPLTSATVGASAKKHAETDRGKGNGKGNGKETTGRRRKERRTGRGALSTTASLTQRRRALYVADVDPAMLVPDRQKVQLTWSAITYRVPREKRRFARCRGYGEMKTILNDVSGYVAPGEMVAIIGPSGAGKTSLLNVLSRRIKMGSKPHRELLGKVQVNGVTPSRSEFGRISGFVAQDDVLMGSSTAHEALMFAAEMTLGDGVSKSDKEVRVNQLLDVLGLSGVRDNFIGFTGQAANNSGIKRGLSGGERKRLSGALFVSFTVSYSLVAHELIHDPLILFLDEPTSGLDSFAALTVVRSLQKLAFLGRTIVCTIHQPSAQVFNMFDKVMILADGQTAYFGSPVEAPAYFAASGYPMPKFENPADFMMKVVQGSKTKPSDDGTSIESGFKLADKAQLADLVLKFDQSDMYRDTMHPPAPPTNTIPAADETGGCCTGSYKTSYVRQFGLLVQRSWLTIVREPMLSRARIMQAFVIGILAGLIFLRLNYFQTGLSDRIGAAFFIITSAVFGSINGPTYVFPTERGVFFRERQAGMYSPSMYFWAKVLTQLPINVFVPVLQGTVAWWMIGFNDEVVPYFIFLLVTVLLSNVAFALGLAMSAFILDPAAVQRIQPLILLPFMLFGGFFLNADNTPIYFIWLKYLSFLSYGFRVVMNKVLEGQEFWCKAADFRTLPILSAPLGGIVYAPNGTMPPNEIAVCPITEGEQMITFLGLDYEGGQTWWTDCLILLGMSIVYLALAWFGLRFRRVKL